MTGGREGRGHYQSVCMIGRDKELTQELRHTATLLPSLPALPDLFYMKGNRRLI